MIMYLNDAKVARRFGSYPERGISLKGTSKKVTVGVKFNLFKCVCWRAGINNPACPRPCILPDDNVVVTPRIALICVSKGKWKVLVEPVFREQAEQFLIEHCKWQEDEMQHDAHIKEWLWHNMLRDLMKRYAKTFEHLAKN